jgi:transcriptional regulator with XRE-family HTH domain
LVSEDHLAPHHAAWLMPLSTGSSASANKASSNRARRRANLTQVELARQLGKPQSVISAIKAGMRRVDLVEFMMIVHAFGAIGRQPTAQPTVPGYRPDPLAAADAGTSRLTPEGRIKVAFSAPPTRDLPLSQTN